MIWQSFFPVISFSSGFFRFFRFFRSFFKSSDFFTFDHISLRTELIVYFSQMWYDNHFSGISSGFQIFFQVFSGFFSNLQISSFLTIYLYMIEGLVLKYDMIIFFFGTASGFRIFSRFSRVSLNLQISSVFTIILYRIDCLLFLNVIWKFFFPKFHPVSRFFPDFPDFFQISRFLWFWQYFFTWISNMIW